jgi:hypothetical protein
VSERSTELASSAEITGGLGDKRGPKLAFVMEISSFVISISRAKPPHYKPISNPATIPQTMRLSSILRPHSPTFSFTLPASIPRHVTFPLRHHPRRPRARARARARCSRGTRTIHPVARRVGQEAPESHPLETRLLDMPQTTQVVRHGETLLRCVLPAEDGEANSKDEDVGGVRADGA